MVAVVVAIVVDISDEYYIWLFLRWPAFRVPLYLWHPTPSGDAYLRPISLIINGIACDLMASIMFVTLTAYAQSGGGGICALP